MSWDDQVDEIERAVMEDKCHICGGPINPKSFWNQFEGDRCLLFCSQACSDIDHKKRMGPTISGKDQR